MQLYQTIRSETETWQISVLCYLRCSSLCNTEVFRALGKGRAERKVNAAVGMCRSSRQRQGATLGKGEAEGKAAEICGSCDGAEEAERFSSKLKLWC